MSETMLAVVVVVVFFSLFFSNDKLQLLCIADSL